ncbi:MAG: CrcB family protein [Acidimicrobiia bacterium]|nr:CrcB family protein [Acidimicrobiia bacterium]
MIHVAVLAGGALGGLLRFVTTAVSQRLIDEGDALPWWTLLANLTGSFVLGLLGGSLAHGLVLSPSVVAGIGAGFAGGLTTFSTFSVETVLLGRERSVYAAAAYVVLSFTLGLLAIVGGIAAGAGIAGM